LLLAESVVAKATLVYDVELLEITDGGDLDLSSGRAASKEKPVLGMSYANSTIMKFISFAVFAAFFGGSVFFVTQLMNKGQKPKGT
jgi:hypothetical protein